MAKRILVTGGAGFIGSHLSAKLLDRGDSVVVLDDFSTGREQNLARLRGRPGFELVRDSVESESSVHLLMSRVDAVFHLASAVGVQLILDQPVRTIRTTIHGTEVVLEAANKFGRPVLITSSSEVYGKGMRVPFDEDDDIVMGPHPAHAVVLCVRQGDRRISGAGVSKTVRLAGDDRPAVQHGGTGPGGAVRDGACHGSWPRPKAGKPFAGVRRRETDPVLLSCIGPWPGR